MPDVLSAFEFWLLIGLSGFTSFLTAAIGLGGGTLLLAAMAQILPGPAIIPLHGAVQLGSNLGRTVLLKKFISNDLVLWFLIGGLFGVVIGGQLAIDLPTDFLRLAIGCFVIYSVWAPKWASIGVSKLAFVSGAFVTSLLTMFVGATGPLIMALHKPHLIDRRELVANSAAAMTLQHLLKVVVFGFLGFVYSPYLALLMMMITTGVIGTLLGKKVLIDMDPLLFRRALKLIMTVLGINLIATSLDVFNILR